MQQLHYRYKNQQGGAQLGRESAFISMSLNLQHFCKHFSIKYDAPEQAIGRLVIYFQCVSLCSLLEVEISKTHPVLKHHYHPL